MRKDDKPKKEEHVFDQKALDAVTQKVLAYRPWASKANRKSTPRK